VQGFAIERSLGSGQILEASRGGEESLTSNVRVSAGRRETGVIEVCGDEARVAELLPEAR
jgi:hypothetical protein